MEIHIGWGKTVTGRVKYLETFLDSKAAVATQYGITANNPILLCYSSGQKNKKAQTKQINQNFH